MTIEADGAAVEDKDPRKSKKLDLEISKLELEIRNADRTFYAQLFNTISVILIALMVLYFYQRPQLEQAHSAQSLAERQQIGSLLINAQSINSRSQQADIIKLLSDLFPNYSQLKIFARASEALLIAERAQSTSDGGTSRPANDAVYICSQLSNSVAALSKSASEFRVEVSKEAMPILSSLGLDVWLEFAEKTKREVDGQLQGLKKREVALGCK